jgi:hypothetical protein
MVATRISGRDGCAIYRESLDGNAIRDVGDVVIPFGFRAEVVLVEAEDDVGECRTKCFAA